MDLENENIENNLENDTQDTENIFGNNLENNLENSGEENRYRGERRHYFNRDGGDKDGNPLNSPRRRYFKKKVCFFCKNDIDILDYKDIKLLKRYVKESGKIVPKRLNGTCAKHQRMVTKAVKRARNIALLPYETRY